jgi:hypothetical protein
MPHDGSDGDDGKQKSPAHNDGDDGSDANLKWPARHDGNDANDGASPPRAPPPAERAYNDRRLSASEKRVYV